MERQYLEELTPGKVSAAIRRAARYAEGKGVPLTAERIAAELGIRAGAFRAIAAGHCRAEGKQQRLTAAAMEKGAAMAAASVVEHGMTRGSGAHMHLLYLKQEEQAEGGEEAPAVCFTGEDRLEE